MKKSIIIIIILLNSFNLFAQKLIPYRKGNLWGYSDVNKAIIIKPEYEYVTYFIENEPDLVLKNKRVGLMAVNGKIVIPIEYKFIEKNHNGYKASTETKEVYFDNDFKRINMPQEENIESQSPVDINYNYSKSDELLRESVRPTGYDDLGEFIVNKKYYFIAAKGGVYGVIDENNNVLIPFVYDYLHFVFNIHIKDNNGNNPILLTGKGKFIFEKGKKMFEGKLGLRSLFNSKIYLEPKYDLVHLPNTSQFIDNEQFVCVVKDGKERIWNIKTGIEYFED